MLSRLAANASWLARYLERAENTARVLTAAMGSALAPEATADPARAWRTALALAGDPELFAGAVAATPAGAAERAIAVIAHLVCDRDNPSSMISSLGAVRENGRTVRHALTAELWDAISSTWLDINALDADAVQRRGVDEVLARIRQHCQWIRGAISDLNRDEIFHVLAYGQAVERADFMARLLAASLAGAASLERPAIGTARHRDWVGMLVAAGCLEAYRRAYEDIIDPRRVAELLVRHPASPRTLAGALALLESALLQLTSNRGGTSQALAGARELVSDVRVLDSAALVASAAPLLGISTRLAAVCNAANAELFHPTPVQPAAQAQKTT